MDPLNALRTALGAQHLGSPDEARTIPRGCSDRPNSLRAGFAYGGVDNEISAGGITAKNTGTATGYTIGGGYEYKFAPAWSLKAEYQYVNLGRNDPVLLGVDICTAAPLTCHDDAYHTVRFGLNYSFGADRYAPLK